jgi:hypothetical protein
MLLCIAEKREQFTSARLSARMSVFQSFRLHGTTRLPLDGFL